MPTVQEPLLLALPSRILALSADTAPEQLPPHAPGEDLALGMRRKAERSLRYALLRRTWWRLTPEERSTICAEVLSEAKDHVRLFAAGWGSECVGVRKQRA